MDMWSELRCIFEEEDNRKGQAVLGVIGRVFPVVWAGFGGKAGASSPNFGVDSWLPSICLSILDISVYTVAT